jgi:hypothetical protein
MIDRLLPLEAARQPGRRIRELHDRVVGKELDPALHVVSDELEVLVEGLRGVTMYGARHGDPLRGEVMPAT